MGRRKKITPPDAEIPPEMALVHLRRQELVVREYTQAERFGSGRTTPKARLRKMRLILRGLNANYGNITQACKAAGVSTLVYYRWIKREGKVYDWFRRKVSEVPSREAFIDFIEGEATKRIKEGNAPVLIHALKTKGRSRGWSDREPAPQPKAEERAAKQIAARIDRYAVENKISWAESRDVFLLVMGSEIAVEVRTILEEM